MKHLIIGTAGHVDHGKTALVKALTDIDCDTHKEEKERGITINLGFSHLNLPSGESIGIVDVPGHKDFIKTMVAGAFGIDIAMLVIAADSGIMPQTEEHLRIIEMLGISKGIIVLTKTDLVDEETIELAELEISEFLEGSVFENAPIIPVSSINGTGIEDLLNQIERLIPQVEERKSGDQFRMYIDRIFNVKGIGFVVTGSVLEGSVKTGQELFLLPGKLKKIKVRNIERHGGAVENVNQGDRAALNLAGLKFDDFERGMVISDKVLEDTNLIDATVHLFDQTTVLSTWSNVIFYTGTFECAARMHLIDQEELHPGQNGIVQIHLTKASIVAVKDKFIVRNSSNNLTLGGGTVIDNRPLNHKKRTEKLIATLTELTDATLNSDKLSNLVKIELNKINKPVFSYDVAQKISQPADKLILEVAKEKTGSILIFGQDDLSVLVMSKLDEQYSKMVIAELTTYHQKNPILEHGMEANEFYGKFDFNKNEAGKIYLDFLLERLFKEGKIKKYGSTSKLSSFEVKIDRKTKDELDWLEGMYRNVGMDLPIPNKLSEAAHGRKISRDRLKMLQKYLSTKGILYYFDGEFIHKSVVDKARLLLLKKVMNIENGINEKEFRELINGTRKVVQKLLGIFLIEKIVSKPSFYIFITDKGKEVLQEH